MDEAKIALQEGLTEYKLGDHFEIVEVSVVRDEFENSEYKYPFDKHFTGFENDYCFLSLYDENPRAFDSYDLVEDGRLIAFHAKDSLFQAEYLTDFINSNFGENFISDLQNCVEGSAISRLNKSKAKQFKIYLPKPEHQHSSKEFDRFSFDFREVDDELLLYCFESPLLTAQGKEIRSKDASFFEQLISELEGFEVCRLRNQKLIRLDGICSYSLYSDMVDIISTKDPVLENFVMCLHSDKTFYRSAGPEQVDQMGRWAGIFRMLDSKNIMAWENKEVLGLDDYPVLMQDSELDPQFVDLLREVYRDLTDAEKVCIFAMLFHHGAGVMLPLAFMTQNCSVEEYVDGVMAANATHHKIFSVDSREHRDSFRGLKEDARTMKSFVERIDSQRHRVLETLDLGEGDFIEFKSSLRYNQHSKQRDENITLACLKAIAGFLNKDGGRLFIGINDDGDVVGLDSDQFQNDDRFLLHLKDKTMKVLGEYALSKLSFNFHALRGKRFCEVVISRSENPVYMKIGNQEHFCVRTGPSTTTLPASQIHPYIADRFVND